MRNFLWQIDLQTAHIHFDAWCMYRNYKMISLFIPKSTRNGALLEQAPRSQLFALTLYLLFKIDVIFLRLFLFIWRALHFLFLYILPVPKRSDNFFLYFLIVHLWRSLLVSVLLNTSGLAHIVILILFRLVVLRRHVSVRNILCHLFIFFDNGSGIRGCHLRWLL